MALKGSPGGAFDWKLVDEDYVQVYEGLDRDFNQVYTKSARALADLAAMDQGGLALDLACGTGLSTAVLASAVGERGRVIGLEVNPHMLARARQRLGDRANVELHLADLAHFDRLAQELNLEGRADAVLSSFSYFYLYDFHEALQAAVYRVLKPGGRLVFNIGTFLSRVDFRGRTYNTFVELFDHALDGLLKEEGLAAGLDPPPPRPSPIYTRWDLSILERLGYRRIEARPWPLPLSASLVYRYSIDGFHRHGLGYPSRTLMGLAPGRRIALLEETLARCGPQMDRRGLKSHILNVAAVK